MQVVKKVQSFGRVYGRKFMCLFCVVLMLVLGCVTAFAAEGTSDAVTPSGAATQVFDIVKTQMNMTTILSVLGVALLAALGMVLGWWAIRKVYSMLLRAFTKGRGGA